MTLTLFDSIQQIVREEVGRMRTAELATVQKQHPHASSGDSDNYACTVVLRDSGIVLSRVPVATERIGSASIPAVGELVLVQFLNGDVNAPVIIGRLYNDADRPPPNDDGQAILHLPLGASDDQAVHVEVHSDTRKAIVKLGTALALTVQDDDPVVKVDVAGQASLKIGKDGSITIESQTDISIKGSSNVKIEAAGQLTLKGATVNIN
ncbi:MAG: phage baseplate assembly protein V [Gaiellaceae bacterium]